MMPCARPAVGRVGWGGAEDLMPLLLRLLLAGAAAPVLSADEDLYVAPSGDDGEDGSAALVKSLAKVAELVRQPKPRTRSSGGTGARG